MLQQFAKEWLAWVEAGAPDHQEFHTSFGLCICVRKWAMAYKGLCTNGAWDLAGELAEKMGLVPFPFNEGSSFYDETVECRKHLNPLRLEFAKKLAEGLV